MKKIIPLYLIVLICFSGFSQTREIDSLKAVIQNPKNSLSKTKAYEKLGYIYILKNTTFAEKYLDSAMVGYKKINSKKDIADVEYKYGLLYRFRSEYNKALEQFDKTINFSISIKDSIVLGNAFYETGVIKGLQGNYQESLKYLYKALKIQEILTLEYNSSKSLNAIGGIYKDLKEYDKAEEFLLKAITINKKNNNIDDLANAYSNLGSLYSLIDKNEESLLYFEKCLEIDLKSKYDWGIASDYQNIGNTLLNLERYEDALKNLDKAYKIQNENNYEYDKVFVMIRQGYALAKLNKFNESERVLTKALNFNIDSKPIRKDLYLTFSQLYKENKQFQKSRFYLDKHIKVKDSIFEEEQINNINNLRLQYQTEKKDKEIAEQQLSIQKSKSKTRLMTILIISLLLASILLWFVFQQRQKRIQQQLVSIQKEQEVRTLESLIIGEEKERLRISQELHDGVNGDLSAIKYKLSSLLKMNNEVINEAVTMIDNSCQQVRAISHNLVPPSLKDFNLVEAIDNYCENMNSTHQPEISFQHIGDTVSLNKKIEINIFRIIQELTTNALKHADAKTIDVQISNLNNTLLVTIEDNGKGYKIKNDKAEGIGLNNIKSRVEYLNATLDIVTNESGTSNTVEIDLNKIEKEL